MSCVNGNVLIVICWWWCVDFDVIFVMCWLWCDFDLLFVMCWWLHVDCEVLIVMCWLYYCWQGIFVCNVLIIMCCFFVVLLCVVFNMKGCVDCVVLIQGDQKGGHGIFFHLPQNKGNENFVFMMKSNAFLTWKQ